MLYIILNDGETYTAVKGSIIFDSVTQKMYTIRRSKQIKKLNTSWNKGINEILDGELEDMHITSKAINNKDDNGILDK